MRCGIAIYGNGRWPAGVERTQAMRLVTEVAHVRTIPTGSTTAGDIASHAAQTQTQHVFVLTLKGENVGEFVNQQFLPGYTFGWAPRDHIIAYRNLSGRLAFMDEQGQKQQVDATKNVILPAWSNDGHKIAFLQRAGKNKYDLFVVAVQP